LKPKHFTPENSFWRSAAASVVFRESLNNFQEGETVYKTHTGDGVARDQGIVNNSQVEIQVAQDPRGNPALKPEASTLNPEP
jgi:hypothetical protein